MIEIQNIYEQTKQNYIHRQKLGRINSSTSQILQPRTKHQTLSITIVNVVNMTLIHANNPSNQTNPQLNINNHPCYCHQTIKTQQIKQITTAILNRHGLEGLFLNDLSTSVDVDLSSCLIWSIV